MQTNHGNDQGAAPAANADPAAAAAAAVPTGAPAAGAGGGTGGEPAGAPAAKPAADANGAVPATPPGEQAATPPAGEADPAKPGEAQPKPDEEATGAPESYADFTLPEGVPEGMVLEPESTSAFKEVAKAYNLSQAQAQKFVDLAAGLVKKTLTGFQEAAVERIETWATQAKADPVVGGKDFEQNVQIAQQAIAQFGDPELEALYNEFGLGNNPALVRFCYRIGKAMNEGTFVQGQGQESRAVPVNREEELVQRIKAEQSRGK
jgi:hypothetical protein